MPRGRKVKPKEVVEEKTEVLMTPTEPVVSEKDQVKNRHAELTVAYEWLKENKFNDIGQLEMAISQANQRLLELKG